MRKFLVTFSFIMMSAVSAFAVSPDYRLCDGDGDCLDINSSGQVQVTGGSGAPTDATYITQTANASLSAEQALSGLSTGIMRVATTTGVVTSLTDSSGIAANISDEQGSGALVFATSPTLTTPNIGVATATSVTATSIALSDGLLDGVGAVDLDIGSADVTDVTVVTDGGTVVLDGSVTASTAIVDLVDPSGAVDLDLGSADVTDVTVVTDGGTIVLDGDYSSTAGNITLDNGVVFIKEQAEADADQAGYGQLWVDLATPNKLYFTDDAGTDTDLTASGSGAFSDSADPVVLNTTTKDVHIGDSAGSGKLLVDGDADQVQFTIRGHSTQTSDLIEVENNAGTPLFQVAQDGGITGITLDNAGTAQTTWSMMHTGGITYVNGASGVVLRDSNANVLTANATNVTLAQDLVLTTAASPANTTDGSVKWDSDDDYITAGDGSATVRVGGFLLWHAHSTSETAGWTYNMGQGTDADDFEVPVNLRCGSFRAQVDTAPSPGNWDMYMNVNGSGTFTCNIAAGSTSCTAATVADVAQGARINFQAVANASPAGSAGQSMSAVCWEA